MALRTILYGYKVENGKTVINREEAETVKMVFSLYSSGKTLNNIATLLTERKIVYFQGESKWNKNTINRMIENEKYMGNEIYPQIITPLDFQSAAEKKHQKSCKQEKHSAEVEYLRTICVCDRCGNRYKRVNTWRTREKWMCSAGCGCEIYIDDSVLQKAVVKCLNSAIEVPNELDAIVDSQYTPTKEVLKEENEMYRLMEQNNLNFSTVSKSIMRGASVRFNCCHYDKGEITEEVKREIGSIPLLKGADFVLMKKYIKQVRVNPNGKIITVFINNSKITVNGGAENAS